MYTLNEIQFKKKVRRGCTLPPLLPATMISSPPSNKLRSHHRLLSYPLASLSHRGNGVHNFLFAGSRNERCMKVKDSCTRVEYTGARILTHELFTFVHHPSFLCVVCELLDLRWNFMIDDARWMRAWWGAVWWLNGTQWCGGWGRLKWKVKVWWGLGRERESVRYYNKNFSFTFLFWKYNGG